MSLPQIFSRNQLDTTVNFYKSQPSFWLLHHPFGGKLWIFRNPMKFKDLSGHTMRFTNINAMDKLHGFATSYLNQALSNIILRNHTFSIPSMIGRLPKEEFDAYEQNSAE